MKFDAKEMGKRIKNIRVNMEYTQEEFAEFLHISGEIEKMSKPVQDCLACHLALICK